MSEPNQLPTPESIYLLLDSIDFTLPGWYVALMSQTHEKIFEFEEGKYLHMWPLAEVVDINEEYNFDDDAFSDFFLIGTYEVGEACAIEKETGDIYTVPFIGDIPEDTTYVGRTLEDLVEYLQEPW
ncbi:hypothetical protein [Hymenobacter wooponensis]|uniref:SMI1/KNR4 family protein n=1 Tax=Hymenobacter wooponensis TaxID=1525360 RepID=A0A4Z0MMP0_9BACT|nr:hypothetical protein [Hymenobacter wooponensis]TGD80445.1 hypothetical protein EU557_11440 [Hymenobacter wooponensis]